MKLKSIEEVVDKEYWTEEWDGSAQEIILLMKADRQHTLQTIRKEVEGMKKNKMVTYESGRQVRNTIGITENALLDDILTILTTLEEEVVE
jgi:hypothetical protein